MPDEAREVIFPQGIPVVVQAAASNGTSENLSIHELESGPPSKEKDATSTKAEGGLHSEAGIIKEQARHAQPLEIQENLLPVTPSAPADRVETRS